MQTQTYNGWTNYETWAWKLWLDNEEPSYRHWQAQAKACLQNSEEGKVFSKEERAAMNLADMLKEDCEDGAEAMNMRNGPYCDLLNAAISEINWKEIATHMIEDINE